MSAPVALTVFEIPDSECPGAVLSLAVCAFGRSIRVSNTTEQPVTHPPRRSRAGALPVALPR